MLRYISIMGAALCMCSCATLTGISRKYIAVETPNDEIVTLNGDTLRYGTTPYEMAVQLGLRPGRSNIREMSKIINRANSPKTVYGFFDAAVYPLYVNVHSSDTLRSYRLEPFNGGIFYVNLCNLGLGMLIDLTNEKRLEYPDLYWYDGEYRLYRKRRLHVPRRSEKFKTIRYDNSFLKRRFNISLSLPWTQLYFMQPASVNISRCGAGFMGIGAGLEYLYKDKSGLAVEWSVMAGFPIPVAAAVHFTYSGSKEWFRAMNLSLSRYFHLRYYTLGYGINFTRNSWIYNYNDKPLEEGGEVPPPTFGTESLYEQYWSAGVVASAYVNLTPKIIFGVTYRPTFYRFTRPRKFCYEHTISLDLKFYLLKR